MKEEYKELYLQQGDIMRAALEKTACYLNAIERLNREENVVIRNFVPPKFRNLKPPEIGKVK